MKVVLLANANSVHTRRWAAGLQQRGHEVHLVSASLPDDSLSHELSHVLPFRPNLGYYLNAFHLRKLLDRLKPDIVHAHYASGYGTLMRVCGYGPYILSVWGDDVYKYPDGSPLSRRRVQKNLRSASFVCSTSRVMARRVCELCPEISAIDITPFGVDTTLFQPVIRPRQDGLITVGIVKGLAPEYGVDVLLRAFATARNSLAPNHSELTANMRLRIVGGGGEEHSLKGLAKQLGIWDVTEFVGPVPHSDVPRELQRLDIYVAVSRFETFGVAIIEASACGVPVIVSDRGGLPEVVVDGETGLIVPGEDVPRTASALIELLHQPEIRNKMGAAGRRFVKATYEWESSVGIMEGVYRKFLEKHPLSKR